MAMAALPAFELDPSLPPDAAGLLDTLNAAVIGQRDATEQIVRALVRYAQGVRA